MSRTIIRFEVSNYADVQATEDGRLPADQVRKVWMNGVVDTGASRLVLPKAVVDQLGLPLYARSTVRYADQRTAERDVVKHAYVVLVNRGGVFKAVVEPDRTDALIGAIVMEDLDLLVDCTGQKVVPRDPHTLVTEIE